MTPKEWVGLTALSFALWGVLQFALEDTLIPYWVRFIAPFFLGVIIGLTYTAWKRSKEDW